MPTSNSDLSTGFNCINVIDFLINKFKLFNAVNENMSEHF